MDDASVTIVEVQGPAYATFTVRARALVIDAAVIAAGLIVLVLLGSFTESLRGSGLATVIGIFALLLLYEPVLVSLYGATLGHRWSNLRVISDSTGNPPSFVVAFLRFILKTILGFPSFFTMAFTRRHQALHDLLTRTTVQLRDVAIAQDFEYVNERAEDPGVMMPAPWRRLAVSFLYLIAAFVVSNLLTVAILSRQCVLHDSCGSGDRAVSVTIGGVFLLLIPLILILGWQGRLPGARRRVLVPNVDAA